MAVKNYRVTARRSGEWWALDVPELPGVHSQTKRLEQAEAEISEAIALMLDCEPEDFSVEISPELPAMAQAVLEQLNAAREAAEQVTEALRLATMRAVLVLTEDLSQRDVGRLLGVSFQRVHQLKDAAPPLSELELRFEPFAHLLLGDDAALARSAASGFHACRVLGNAGSESREEKASA